MQKSILYQVTDAIDILVIAALFLAILFGRNNDFATRLKRFANEFVCVIAPIRQKKLSGNAVDQGCGLGAIRCGTRCNNNSDRHTMRIHGQMYFTVEPPFVRSIPWLPPLAPAA